MFLRLFLLPVIAAGAFVIYIEQPSGLGGAAVDSTTSKKSPSALLKMATTTKVEVDSGVDPSSVWKDQQVANTFTDIRDSVPLAQEQLDLMVRIIRQFQQHHQPASSSKSFTWLDLGCGDGPLGRRLLQEFPESKGTCLDFSEPMLTSAKARIEALGSTAAGRVTLVQGDLSSPSWMDSLPPSQSQKKKVDVIVSGFAIHHLTNERKQALYRELYNLLSPGGVFLNLEHVSAPSPAVEAIFGGAFVDSMHGFFQGTKSYEDCQKAVDYDLNVDEGDILAPAETQCEWLREVGFQHVDIYFKFLILALFGGVKQTEE